MSSGLIVASSVSFTTSPPIFSNLLLKDRKLRITRKNELIAMEELAIEEKAIRNRLEPLGFGSDKAKLWEEYAQSPTMLRRLDSNQRPMR